MSIFRRKYKIKATGKQRELARYYVRVSIGRKRYEIPAYTDRAASEALDHRIQRLKNIRAWDSQLDADTLRWLDRTDPKLRERLCGIGLVENWRGNALDDLLEAWHQSITAKGSTGRQADDQKARAKRLFDACGFLAWHEIEPDAVEAQLMEWRQEGIEWLDGRRMTAQTSNYYLRAAKQFTRWMVARRHAPEDPLLRLDLMKGKAIGSKTRIRRAPTPEELDSLIEAALNSPAGKTVNLATGPQRASAYWFSAWSGFRSGEVRALRRKHFHLDDEIPWVELPGSDTKDGKPARMPLPPQLLGALVPTLRQTLPEARVFPMGRETARMIRRDLKPAGIKYKDESDRILDFHSLRRYAPTQLGRRGVHPNLIHRLERHSTMEMTLHYTDTEFGEMAEAQRVFPEITAVAPASGGQIKATAHGPPHGPPYGPPRPAEGCSKLREGAGGCGQESGQMEGSESAPTTPKSPKTPPMTMGGGWRERMGIEPTGPAVHGTQPALKAGRHTSTDPLPSGDSEAGAPRGRNGLSAKGREIAGREGRGDLAGCRHQRIHRAPPPGDRAGRRPVAVLSGEAGGERRCLRPARPAAASRPPRRRAPTAPRPPSGERGDVRPRVPPSRS